MSEPYYFQFTLIMAPFKTLIDYLLITHFTRTPFKRYGMLLGILNGLSILFLSSTAYFLSKEEAIFSIKYFKNVTLENLFGTFSTDLYKLMLVYIFCYFVIFYFLLIRNKKITLSGHGYILEQIISTSISFGVTVLLLKISTQFN